jgi:hypothetical protein
VVFSFAKINRGSELDGFVKSPTAVRLAHGPELSRRAALRFIFRHCGVLVSTPLANTAFVCGNSSRFASLAFGAFYFAVPILTFYETIKLEVAILTNGFFPQNETVPQKTLSLTLIERKRSMSVVCGPFSVVKNRAPNSEFIRPV